MIRFDEHKGAFIKHCPCTPGVIPCGYYNLNLHTGCPYRCSYCILQAYLETPEPVYFSNIEDMEQELAEVSRTQPYLRMGTGELSDSLAFDPQAGYSQKILSIFERFPKVVFEFKTKSTHIDPILEYKASHRTELKNIVISWSLNPEAIIRREENLTPDLSRRLRAIQAAQAHGLAVGIHFDPLIYVKEWKRAYAALIDALSTILDPGRIAWWSLGALRFPHALRDHIFKHRDSCLFEGELVKGHDGKYRYFKPLRQELFHVVARQIRRSVSRDVPLYLCMEDRDMWQDILPEISPEESVVNRYLYESVFKS
ncbi:MAG: SPL family radical SAM protein [Candidatus Omnitrophota bacterium]